MGDGRQDQKATPVRVGPGADPAIGKAPPPGKAPPLPPRATSAANGAPGSGVSPIAPVAAASAAAHGGDDPDAIPIDTEPPAPLVVQSGDTAPPPPELAVGAVAVPGPAPTPVHASAPVSVPPGAVVAVEVEKTSGASDPSAVDFDALHAALGEGSREAAPPVAVPSASAAKPARAVAADSQGRSSATYASTDAKAPPVAHIDADLQAPAVIVAQDEAPAYPHGGHGAQMTTPMAPPMTGLAPMGSPMAPMTSPMGAPMSPMNQMAAHPAHPSSGPHPIGTPSSGGMLAASPHAAHMATGNTPQAFDPVALGLPPARPGQVQLTMRMPERPRRPRTPTVVVRQRGPSTKQKVFVFSVMLLLVSLIGLGIVMWRAPQLFGLGPKAQATTAPKPVVTIPPATTTAPTASATVSASPSASIAPSASASAAASASAKPGVKPPVKGR